MNACAISKYYLESTGDKTDRTREIEVLLREHGACLLGTGVFYVSGVTMPDDSCLMGMGPATRVILDESLEEGYAVRLTSRCTVKDIFFLGSSEKLPYPETLGSRHGLLFEGTATSDNWRATIAEQPHSSIIESCQFRYFSGGAITCKKTGYSTSASITASDCHMMYCGCGVYIPRFSEYHEFTNILCSENLYGCINNGGNNVFVNCGFNSNKTAFIIDNADGLANNNSHGSVIGCTFNHSDNNTGIGIGITGAQSGHVFSGCQVFYSKIILADSDAILFNSFNFGRNTEIEVKAGTLAMFTNCVFHSMPKITVEDNDKVKFLNCFTKDGEPVTL